MKTGVVSVIGGVVALAMSVVPAIAAVSQTGSGAPSGAHYNLNIIGVPKGKTADMTGNNGRRIFVPENGKTKILLTEGDFQVLDANGTDANGAKFQLPNPDVDGDGITSYSVYVRALGKPNGSAKMQSCYTDATGTWCAVSLEGGVEQIDISRSTGKSSFENVTKDLLYVDYCASFVDANLDGILTADECTNIDQVPLFGATADEYFWEYDNSGLKLAQFRFYEVPTNTGWVN